MGIGKNNPAYPLDVVGYMRGTANNASVGNASSMQFIQNGSGDAAISFLIGATTEWLAGVDNSDSDSFKISNITGSGDFTATGVTLTTGGNFGIGTTTPSTGKFSDASYAFLIQSASTSTGTNIFASNSDNSKFVGCWSGHSGAEPAVGVKTGNALTFGAWAAINGTGGFTEWARFNSTGSIGLNGPSGVHIIRRKAVLGSNGIKIQANANDAVSDTDPGASILLGGGPLTDTYEGNIDLTAYGAVADLNRNQIRFNNRSGVNTVTERMRIDHNGRLGLGITAPTELLHISGTSAISGATHGPRINLQYTGTSGAAESRINFLDFRGTINASIGNYLSDDSVSTYAAELVFKTAVGGVFDERMRLAGGQLQFNNTPHGTAQISNASYSLNVANGGTIDFANFSGMIIVNNWSSGAVGVFICGGGVVALVSSVATGYGNVTYYSPVGGYRWTSNSGTTHTYSFTAIRTRPTA